MAFPKRAAAIIAASEDVREVQSMIRDRYQDNIPEGYKVYGRIRGYLLRTPSVVSPHWERDLRVLIMEANSRDDQSRLIDILAKPAHQAFNLLANYRSKTDPELEAKVNAIKVMKPFYYNLVTEEPFLTGGRNHQRRRKWEILMGTELVMDMSMEKAKEVVSTAISLLEGWVTIPKSCPQACLLGQCLSLVTGRRRAELGFDLVLEPVPGFPLQATQTGFAKFGDQQPKPLPILCPLPLIQRGIMLFRAFLESRGKTQRIDLTGLPAPYFPGLGKKKLNHTMIRNIYHEVAFARREEHGWGLDLNKNVFPAAVLNLNQSMSSIDHYRRMNITA